MLRDALIFGLGFGFIATTGRALGWRPGRRATVVPDDDLRDRFLATLSHELRTPLNAIIGWAQILKMGGLKPSEMVHAIDAIDRNARVEARMVSDLLDVARLRHVPPVFLPAPTDLGAVAHGVVESFRPAAVAKAVTLTFRNAPRAAIVEGEEPGLQQMVRQLVANGLKFTPAGGRIDVSVMRDRKFGRVRVCDDGVGIEPQDLERVSEPFYQGAQRSMRTGLGVGLTLAAQMAARHGGTLEVSSRGRGSGTLAVASIPVARPSG